MADDQKKPVLITGCSSGIGAATARLLAKGKFRVYATARKVADLEELKAAGCETLALDVTDEASMVAAVKAIEEKEGALYGLVNNAGYSQSGAVEAVPLDRVRRQFETNVFGLLRLPQLVLPAMRRKGEGRVVNLSSMGGRLVFPGGGIYHATKYAVEALSDALRFELRGFGIEVVIVEPGLIRTGFASAVESGMKDLPDAGGVYAAFHQQVARASVDAYEKGAAAKLAGTPEDVARTVERALVVRHPRTRYVVSASGKLLITQRRVLGDRGWDAFLRGNFLTPGKG